MRVVGSDRVAVKDGIARPGGRWHAVDLDGRVACGPRPLGYVFPAMAWDGADAVHVCHACRDAVREQLAPSPVDAYPAPLEQAVAMPVALA